MLKEVVAISEGEDRPILSVMVSCPENPVVGIALFLPSSFPSPPCPTSLFLPPLPLTEFSEYVLGSSRLSQCLRAFEHRHECQPQFMTLRLLEVTHPGPAQATPSQAGRLGG